MSFKFKNTGQDLNEIRKRLSRNAKIEEENLIPVGIKTPLRSGSKSGETIFGMNFDLLDQVSDNLKNLLMTQKGERLGRGDFGTNLYKIYSQTNVENPDQLAINEIRETVTKFMPQVSLEGFESKKIDNSDNDPVIYNIDISYKVPRLSEETRNIRINLKMTN